jgi:hypothetical protein
VAGPASAGVSLAELLLVLTFIGLLIGLAVPQLSWLEATSLSRSAAAARIQLQRARMLAVARRQTLRIRISASGSLVLLDPDGERLEEMPLQGDGLWTLDSLRLRPSTLRFNARGQAAPGSLYLYRGHRSVRLVSNFVGRIRQEPLRR